MREESETALILVEISLLIYEYVFPRIYLFETSGRQTLRRNTQRIVFA